MPVAGIIFFVRTREARVMLRQSLAWRQWHHWNWLRNFSKFVGAEGKNVLTVHIFTNGNMNLAYFDFKRVQE
jgi:hypothetical protein